MILKRGMLVLFIAVFISIFFSINFISALDISGCPSSMTSYWKFDDVGDSSTQVIDDYNGNSGDIIDPNDKIGNANGIISSALSLKESDGKQYIKIDDDISLEKDKGTIEMWIKPFSASFGGGFSNTPPAYLLDKDTYYIKFTTEKEIEAKIGGQTITSTTSTNGLSADTWYFVALSWNSSETKLYIYDRNTDTIISEESGGGGISSGELGSDAPLIIGAENETADVNYMWKIDEMALYNKALTPDEIDEHYTMSDGGRDYCYVSGTSSDTDTIYDVHGCNNVPLKGDDTSSGTEDILVGNCSSSGRWYCAAVEDAWDTITKPTACSYGKQSLGEEQIGCCPAGFFCNVSEKNEEGPVCDLRGTPCSSWDNEKECEENLCRWIPWQERCVSPFDDTLSCSIYEDDETICEEDPWNLGKTGLGTHICGTYVGDDQNLVPMSSCHCQFDNEENECGLNYTVQEAFYYPKPEKFECFKTYNVSACIDGEQDVEWTADYSKKSINGVDPTDEELKEAGCVDGSETKTCGEPLVKLPGFTFINILLIIGLLAVFYYFWRE